MTDFRGSFGFCFFFCLIMCQGKLYFLQNFAEMLNDDKCDVFKLKLAVGSYISTGLQAF